MIQTTVRSEKKRQSKFNKDSKFPTNVLSNLFTELGAYLAMVFDILSELIHVLDPVEMFHFCELAEQDDCS